MTRTVALLYALSSVATTLAWAFARHRPDHRPIALLLSVGLISDLARRALRTFALTPAIAAGALPLAGWPRIAGHVSQALFIAWPAGLAALSMVIFARRRPWPVAIAWLLVVAALVVTYPATRGDVLRKAYLATQLAALLVSVGCFLMWARRREGMTLPRGAALLILAVELGTLLGPYRGNVFASWDIAQGMYATLYVVLILVQGAGLWGSSKESRSR